MSIEDRYHAEQRANALENQVREMESAKDVKARTKKAQKRIDELPPDRLLGKSAGV